MIGAADLAKGEAKVLSLLYPIGKILPLIFRPMIKRTTAWMGKR